MLNMEANGRSLLTGTIVGGTVVRGTEPEQQEEKMPPPAQDEKHQNGRSNGHHAAAVINGENPTTISSTPKDSMPKNKRSSSSTGSKTTKMTKCIIRSLLLDMPLAILFLTFIVSTSLLYIYDAYVTKILSASKWRRANRLPNEYTYYKRECVKEDLTTLHATDLLISPNATTDQATDLMMQHGMGLIGSVLTPETTAKLREFVMRRNAELTPAEAIPLDGEERRWSFAIGANEDPIVPVALREVATHPIVRPTLEKLLGEDPALVEITAITSAYGAYNQGWHADVKPLGNAVKYSRTFTHSYSLFTALQDTTGPMGATSVCPGTHYCANDLGDTCAEHGFKVTQAGTWKAGDSLLLNQCAWHRGDEHYDPTAQHRVVFIVTFISRPRFGIDNRQLSHGTYFHIRWDMWGHTLNDLLDAKRYMSHPLAAIRSAGIWKPKDRKWGWDWLTVACLRIANDQNGYTPYELVEWVENFEVFGLPRFLWGPVSAEDGYGWEAFIRGTLERFAAFFGSLTLAVLVAYLLFTKVIYLVQYYWRGGKDSGLFRAVLRRLVYSYGVVMIAACVAHIMIHKSPWAESIRSGRFLMRPFPDPSTVEIKTQKSPTTIPSVYDVLIGSRFDSRDIGIYNRFLNYHPGNTHLSDWLEGSTDAFTDSSVLQDALIASIVKDISENGGRYLQQNELGHWVRLSKADAAEYTRKELMKKANPLLAALDQEVAFMLAEARYGPFRGPALTQRYGQEYLFKWRRLLFDEYDGTSNHASTLPKQSHGFRPRIFALPPAPRTIFQYSLIFNDNDDDENSVNEFLVGDHVEANYNDFGVWFEARVRDFIQDENTYELEYMDGDTGAEPAELLRPYSRPLEEGDRVSAEVSEEQWCTATIAKVYPGRNFDVQCDEHSGLVNVKADFIKVPASSIFP